MTAPTDAVRSRITLADGRELFYYDSAPGSRRDRHHDRRAPGERAAAASMRYDALLGEWVTVAGARLNRPYLPTTADCPLCPSTEDALTEVPAPDYEVAVFENRFPSFHGDGSVRAAPSGPFAEAPASGRCEVVCFTSEHDGSFADLGPARVRLVMDALADRTAELSALPAVKQVFCFENRGEEIGVTLHHPHGQIYAYPYVTPVTTRMIDQVARYASRGRDVFAETLAAERAGDRVVAANADWTAFVPTAARWPFEVHLYPHVRVPDLAALPTRYRDSFAPVYLAVLNAFDGLFASPMPYISGWQQAPAECDRDSWYLHLRLFSVRRAENRLKYVAGSESAMGAFVNDIPPEDAARMLRKRLENG